MFDEGVKVVFVGMKGGGEGVASLCSPRHGLLLTAHVLVDLWTAAVEKDKSQEFNYISHTNVS